MSGHTPGPWVQNGTHGHRFIGPEASEDGCVAVACKVDGRDGWKEMEANARLIAAAPDLLEALEKLVLHQEALGRHNTIIDESRAAIARAKGEA